MIPPSKTEAQAHPHCAPEAQAPHHHGHGASGGLVLTSAQATLHCLAGCVIGEVAGLAIGVTLGLGIWPTIILATTLAYISGFALGVLPVMRREDKSFAEALKLIWIGEAVSIGVMEFAMNTVDYAVGGMSASSVFHPMFWYGLEHPDRGLIHKFREQ